MKPSEKLNKILDSWTQNGQLLDVAEILQRGSKLWPDTVAYICQDDQVTYEQLYIASTHLAERLKSSISKGDRVIIYYPNSIEFFIAYFAVWHLGAVVAPLNIFLSIEEFIKICQDATPQAIIISEEHLKQLSAEQLKNLPKIVTASELKETRGMTEAKDIPCVKRDKMDLAALLYTSGTTGFPKGVMLSAYNILYNTAQISARIDISFKTKVFCPLPLFHCLPQNVCVWASSLVGGTAITVSKIDRRSLIQGIEQKPNIIIAVPTLYGAFCLLKNLNFDSVKYFASGADILPDKIRGAFELIYRRKIINGYGMTETAPFISAELDDTILPTSFAGEPFPGIEVSIRNEQGEPINSNEIGILWLKGDNIMMGYYNAPDATDAVLKNGWLNTGDLARLVNGKIELCGRQKDLIVNKGIKIYPQEIENVLLTHEAITMAAVVGEKIENDEIPVAFVATSDIVNADRIEQELKKLCQERLAQYKIPRRFIIRKELPVNQTGKISKKKLKEEL